MDTGTLALLIPIVAIVGSYVISAMKIQKEKGTMSKTHLSEMNALRDEVSLLKSRVEVLERLATDESTRLRKEFESL